VALETSQEHMAARRCGETWSLPIVQNPSTYQFSKHMYVADHFTREAHAGWSRITGEMLRQSVNMQTCLPQHSVFRCPRPSHRSLGCVSVLNISVDGLLFY
jgi:hypothetical protein